MLSLFLLFCASCADDRTPVELSFSALYQGHPVSCTSKGSSLSDLRFFVSDITLIDADGRRHAVPLLRDDRWQTRDLALVDLENGEGGCVNGTRDTHTKIRGTVEEGRYVGLSFTVGVPFDLNHANPLLAEAPLNDAAMHWHWRSGYKFLRAGIVTPGDAFWTHIGSTGCEGTVRNISGCRFPNRVRVVLTGVVDGPLELAVDLSALLAGTDLSDGSSTDCSSGPAESACLAVFGALGLDLSGDGKTRRQRVFQVVR